MELNESSVLLYNKHMDNQHFVLMGDSLMRYQYISLAYLIHNNKVVNPAELPNILLEKTFGGWEPFFAGTHSTLSPNEYCDCSSFGYEHRYYYNPTRNISISFIMCTFLRLRAVKSVKQGPDGVWKGLSTPLRSTRYCLPPWWITFV